VDYEYRTLTVTPPVLQQEVVIRETNAYNEQLIFDDKSEQLDALVSYWASVVQSIGEIKKPVKKNFYDLTEPDRIFLGIEIFKLSISETLSLSGPCAACGDPANFVVDLNTLDLIPLPEGATPGDPTFSVTLPRTKNVVVFGYRTGHQEMAELKNEEFNPSRTAWKAIRSVNGDTDIKLSDIMRWPLADHVVLRKAIVDRQCGYDTRVRFRHKCGKSTVMNIISDPSFLAPGLAW
jgi:hypothetical protein